MDERSWSRLRYGTLAAGAVALGATGVAGAGKLIDSGDIKNRSIKLRDISKKAKKKLKGKQGPAGSPAPGGSLLVSAFTNTNPTSYVAPGSDKDFSAEGDAQALVPPIPVSGFRARGLAVQADAKGPFANLTVTLRVDGAPTALACTTDATGECTDLENVDVPAGSKLAIEAAETSKLSPNAIVSLSLEPA